MIKILFSIIVILPVFWANAQSKRRVYYKYDEAKTSWENYMSGYADTFSLYGSKFRVRVVDTSSIEEGMTLEKLTTKWTIIDYFNHARHFTFSMDPAPAEDINFDGFTDFLVEQRWFYLVFLYNASKHTFVKSGYYNYDATPQKISGYPNLYFDKWEFKFNNWWSYLYVIKDYKRINIGITELKVKWPVGGETECSPAYISIRKITNEGYKELERVTQNISTFDVKKFWQKNIKDFYNTKDISNRTPDFRWPKMSEPISK